jgi:hypothetical protein
VSVAFQSRASNLSDATPPTFLGTSARLSMACAGLLDLTHPPLGDSPTAWCAAVHGALRRHKRRVSNAARLQAGAAGLDLYCASLQHGAVRSVVRRSSPSAAYDATNRTLLRKDTPSSAQHTLPVCHASRHEMRLLGLTRALHSTFSAASAGTPRRWRRRQAEA